MADSEQPEQASPEKTRASHHDTFAFKILSDPVLAAAEIKSLLPPEVIDEIAWENLELDRQRFVSGNLENQYTDLLFKTTIRNRDLHIRLLLEHSSYLKPFELLQALQYQVRQWECDVRERKNSGSPQRLTPIITIILHHSETGWRGRTRFMDYFGLDDDLAVLLRPFVVDFGIVLDDVSKVNTEALMRRPVPLELQIMLFALRYARSGRMVLNELPKIAPAIAVLWQDPNGRLAVGIFFVYLKRVANISEMDFQTVMKEIIEPQLDPEMVALWHEFEAGEKKGELKGMRAALQRQLAHRFGPLSSAHLARIETASQTDLDVMTLRVLTATSVDEVLREVR